MVRGLDYYCRTAFEVVAPGLGAQNAIGGGGRYDGLVRDLGGPDVAGIGFALGVERLAIVLGADAAASEPAPGVRRRAARRGGRGGRRSRWRIGCGAAARASRSSPASAA